ncbi:hypothetical protein N657DRAFT_157553 [Parathielavia appendiculata]|uniref:Uncharacterized protein n=1 Tax=Parathielavia appendiculata TaxID=2587402 RepID=A0AAN6TV67_9PEZI|nr:hypothetical protein N657DRAFT_157553 [Parathielavia appendiculata]
MADAFFQTSIPVAHNAVKSIIFRFAELLMGLFIFKFFSLAAARFRHFTPYLMFAEGWIQRGLFMFSRGFSGATLLVLIFSLINTAASLYGTLLWALDSPGYIFRVYNSTVAEHRYALNPDASYVFSLPLDPVKLNQTTETLPKIMGAELFKSGFNMSLTGEVKRGKPETTEPTRHEGVGARIWLDEEGFSVSADTYASWPGVPPTIDGENLDFPYDCIQFDGGVARWNCTYHNAFAMGFFQAPLGRPEVHFDDESSKNYDSQYILANRVDNAWADYSKGSGTAVMMQVFTVTKGKRRHTFAETVFRATLLTNPGVLFARDDVDDLLRRAAGRNETARDAPMLGQIVEDILRAQDEGVSYNYGVNYAESDNTVIQNTWSYYRVLRTPDLKEEYSIVYTSATNITLIRSEDIENPPGPLEPCDKPFMNEAFGGQVRQTTCAGAAVLELDARFYGTVDTAAVMIINGLGYGRSNVSSESMDQRAMEWVWDNTPRMMDLLVARGYVVSVDPSLVGVSFEQMVVAMSGLQLFLSIFAGVLALAAWAALAYGADDGWSKSMLANLVHTTLYRGTAESKRAYMRAAPDVDMVVHGEGDYLVVDGKPVILHQPPETPVTPSVSMQYFGGNMPKEAMVSGVPVGSKAQGYQYAPVPQ